MDTFFVSHGSPTLSIDDSLVARHFFKSWKSTVLSENPKAILIVSAHWETSEPTVTTGDGPLETIYDYYGFPESMYQIKYPAQGAPDLAQRVKDLLLKSGFSRVKEDSKRGLDHGAWLPLMLMYPEADIPVCQLSLQPHRDGTYHFNLGKALAPLREEGVLIIGSGSATHNLTQVGPMEGPVFSWALEFDAWLKDCLLNERYEDLKHYEDWAPHAKMAHPHPEHLYPLHVALGAAGETAKAELIHMSWILASLSHASFRFTATS